MVSPEEFLRETIGGRPNQMQLSIYEGITFDCACGRQHEFSIACVPILREFPGMRLVFGCPEGIDALTCVRIKGLIRFRFVSLFGTKGGAS